MLRRDYGQVHYASQSDAAPDMTGEGEVTANDIQNGKYHFGNSVIIHLASCLVRFGVRLFSDDRYPRGYFEA